MLTCLSLGQEEEMGVLVGIGFYIRINPTHTKYKNSCLYHYIKSYQTLFDPQNWRMKMKVFPHHR